jgi:hypothetical protein
MTIQLRRYTRLSVLVDMLVNQRLTLVDPVRWEDPNDALMINKYKERTGLKFVGAACLTRSLETFHHWKMFSNGMDGVCVEFDEDELKRYILPHENLRMRNVKYVKVADISNSQRYPLIDMPFFKRLGFAAEHETRIIYESAEPHEYFHIPIDTSCVKRVVISPFMPENLFQSAKHAICLIENCSRMTVGRSRLFDSKTWQRGWDKRMRLDQQ